ERTDVRAPITAVADVEVRAFVAIRLDEAVRAALGAAIEGLRRVARDVAWVVPDNLHLTLKFLGQVRAARTPELVAALTRAASGHAAGATRRSPRRSSRDAGPSPFVDIDGTLARLLECSQRQNARNILEQGDAHGGSEERPAPGPGASDRADRAAVRQGLHH